MENELKQDIRLKIFELRNRSKHQYIDKHEQDVINGKIEVYEEWLEVLNLNNLNIEPNQKEMIRNSY